MVGSGPVMIYRAIQLIQIFLADGRTGELTKVIQEVLADLKIRMGPMSHFIKLVLGQVKIDFFVIDISCWLGVERLAPLRWSHWPWTLLQSRFVGFLQAFSILLISFKHFQSKTFKGEFALTT